MNNDMSGVTEAGYADKIATGIDRIKGDYSTLPRHMQELFTKLRAVSKSEGIDLERTFQDAGGTRFGTISKRLFQSALCIAFQHYPFSVKELDEIVEAYDCGLPDTYNGGLLEVGWRDFANDVLSATVIAKQVGAAPHPRAPHPICSAREWRGGGGGRWMAAGARGYYAHCTRWDGERGGRGGEGRGGGQLARE